MKKNLKVNLIWFGLIIGLFLILKGLELSGIMNLYYIQILMGIGIYTWTSWFHGNWCLFISYHHWYDANI